MEPRCNQAYLDGAGCAVLEPNPVQPLVEVDGVLAGHHLAHGGGLLFLGSHFVALKWQNFSFKHYNSRLKIWMKNSLLTFC